MRQRGTFWHHLLAGALIGMGCVLPGVSGGVMAVSFGLYRPMLEAILHFFRDVKKSFLFLLPLALGGAVGFLIGAKGLGYAMARFETPMLFLFIGFILGGVPDLLREADAGRGYRPRCLWALALGLSLGLLLILLPQKNAAPLSALSPVQALLAGAIEGFGTVVPGVSSSFILIYLGWYSAYLTAVASLDLVTLCLFAAGFAAVALATMKAVQWLFDRAQDYAYYGVLGFLLASIGLVFPGFESGRGFFVDLLALALGLLGAMGMSRLNAAASRA